MPITAAALMNVARIESLQVLCPGLAQIPAWFAGISPGGSM